MNSRIQAVALAISLAAGTSLAAHSVTQADDTTLPVTAQDNLALEKKFSERAAAYHQEAEDHSKMAAEYKKHVANSPKNPYPNPWVVKMEKHCKLLAKDAEKLAKDSEMAAHFYALRAKELEAK